MSANDRSAVPLHLIPGAHGEFFDDPNLGPLAERIAVFLETPAGSP